MSKLYLYRAYDEDDFILSDKTVVIDLDATVLRTFKMSKYLSLDIERKYDKKSIDIKARSLFFKIDNKSYWSILRPQARDFILNCYSHFKYVIFWTAANEKYAQAIIKLLHIYGPRPHFCFSRDSIETIYKDKDGQDIVIKDLHLLSKTVKDKHNIVISVKDMIAIDDLDTTFSKNPLNAIHIPEYDPQPTIDSLTSHDDAFSRINEWIINNINKDIERINKEIF